MRTRTSQAALMAKLAEGRLLSPVSLASQMRRSQRPRPRVESVEEADVVFWVIGDEDQVSVALDIAEGELGAGMGQLTPDDHPGALAPARQVHQVGDLGHLSGLALFGAIRRDGA